MWPKSCKVLIYMLLTNDLGEGQKSVKFASKKRRRRGQWKLCIWPCLKGHVHFYSTRTSQDKTSNAESFDSKSVTSCRISGCLSDVAKEITDSPLVQSKYFRRLYSYRNAQNMNCHFYVMEATLESKPMYFQNYDYAVQRGPKRWIKCCRPHRPQKY